MFFPSKMQIAKITVPNKYSRNVTNALQEFCCIEFVDVEHKVHAATTEEREQKDRISDYLNRLSKLIMILDLDREEYPKKKVEIDVSSLENVFESTKNVLEKTESTILSRFEKLDKLVKIIGLAEHLGGISPIELSQEGDYFSTLIGTVENEDAPEIEWKVHEVTENICFIDSYQLDEYESVVVIYTMNKHSDAIKRILRVYGFRELNLSDIIAGSELSLQSLDPEALKREKEECEKQLTEINGQYGLQLLAAEEQLTVEKNGLDVSTLFRRTPYGTTVMFGWLSKSQRKKVGKIVSEHTNNTGEFEFQESQLKKEETPTNLEHKKFFGPLMSLVTGYGTPLYHELDPTLFMFITFPLIFGLMFADVGHGAVLAFLSALALIAKRRRISVNEFVDYFIKGSELMLLCGISSIFFGFVFGSVFGDHFGSVHHPAHPATPLGHILQEINPVFWFSPMEGSGTVNLLAFQLAPLMTLLVLSFVVGALQITLGLVIRFILALKRGHFIEAITVPLMLIWLYWGALWVVYNAMPRNAAGYITRFSININALMGDPLQLGILAIIPLAIMMLGLLMMHGGEGAMEGLEYALALLSNTISYGRILALNAVHAVLSVLILEPFIDIGLSVGVPSLWIVGILLNTVLVGLLEGLLAFVHTLRLHWVEWFSKFYSGTGKGFVPTTIERQFTTPISRTLA